MRTISIAAIAVLLPIAALAQDKEQKSPAPCSYSLATGEYVEVPIGTKVCRRSPAPYQDQYALLQCIPPLAEIDLVKRGDPRCDKYEDRP